MELNDVVFIWASIIIGCASVTAIVLIELDIAKQEIIREIKRLKK